MQVSVLGASGFVGLHTVDACIREGVDVRAVHRRAAVPLPLRRRAPRAVSAPTPEALAEAMRGCAVAVHAAAYYPRTSHDPAGARARAASELQVVLDACARAGVERMVLVSSTATVAPRSDGAPSGPGDTWPRAPDLGAYHDAKWVIEDLASRERRLRVVVAVPGACLGPEDWRLGTGALWLAIATGRCPPLPDGVVNTVDVRDVGAALARLAVVPDPPDRTLLVTWSGPLRALAGSIARRHGVRPPAACSAADALAAATVAEDAAVRTGARAVPARELVDLVVHGVAVDRGPARRALGRAPIPLDVTLDDTARWAQRLGWLSPSRKESHP